MGLDKDVLLYYKQRGVFTEGLHYRKDSMTGGFTWNVEAANQRLAEARHKAKAEAA